MDYFGYALAILIVGFVSICNFYCGISLLIFYLDRLSLLSYNSLEYLKFWAKNVI